MSDTKVLAEMIVKQEDKIEGLSNIVKDRDASICNQHNRNVKEWKEVNDFMDSKDKKIEEQDIELIDMERTINESKYKIAELKTFSAKFKHERDLMEEVMRKSDKYYIEEKAKASKLNAEKLAYMRIVREVLTDCTEIVEIEDKYKEYLAGVKK